MTLYPILRIVKAPSKERVQAKIINMKTKNEEKYKDKEGDAALVPSIIFQ